ncbi:MAG: hypothetical protein Q8R26_02265 [bacterium]|nr:hypothetical protein [bacterium]
MKKIVIFLLVSVVELQNVFVGKTYAESWQEQAYVVDLQTPQSAHSAVDHLDCRRRGRACRQRHMTAENASSAIGSDPYTRIRRYHVLVYVRGIVPEKFSMADLSFTACACGQLLGMERRKIPKVGGSARVCVRDLRHRFRNDRRRYISQKHIRFGGANQDDDWIKDNDH